MFHVVSNRSHFRGALSPTQFHSRSLQGCTPWPSEDSVADRPIMWDSWGLNFFAQQYTDLRWERGKKTCRFSLAIDGEATPQKDPKRIGLCKREPSIFHHSRWGARIGPQGNFDNSNYIKPKSFRLRRRKTTIWNQSHGFDMKPHQTIPSLDARFWPVPRWRPDDIRCEDTPEASYCQAPAWDPPMEIKGAQLPCHLSRRRSTTTCSGALQ